MSDPTRFGIAALDETQIIEIEEKPLVPKTNYAVVGVYMYNPDVFDIIRNIDPSERNEYEITSVNNEYIRKGVLQYDIVNGRWMDTGTYESYQQANEILYALDNTLRY